MRRSRWPGVARQLFAEVPDADLLERYVAHKADDAFALLVARYSRLVWGQCRNLLPNDADADDAFQATFLTLARSAKSIRAGAPLGPWLHGVAFRVCKNARRANGRRAKREKACAQPEANRPVADSTWEAAFAAVAEEVQKLPEAQRTAFVLCCIEGQATTAAAASLGQKLGTFSARLTRAKQTLLDRLAKRGIGAGVLALGGVTGSVAAAPAALISRTLLLVPSGAAVPSSIHALMQGVTGMALIRFKLLAAGVMVATGLGLSAGGGWYTEATAQGPGAPSGGASGLPAPKADPPKADPNIDKLKADLEKAKAELAKAELAKARDDEATLLRRWMLDAPPKYEYEYLPEYGLSPQTFEAKLAEREKNGWTFVGQVDLNLGDKGIASPKLVFRKRPNRNYGWSELNYPVSNDIRELLTETAPLNLAVPKVAKPAEPVPPPADMLPKGPVVPKPNDPAGRSNWPPLPNSASPFESVIQPGWAIPPDPKDAKVAKLEAELKAMMNQVEALRLELAKRPKAEEKPKPEPMQMVLFTKKDYGNWEVEDLMQVLAKLLAEDAKETKTPGQIALVREQDGFTVTGPTETVAAAKVWVGKLKK